MRSPSPGYLMMHAVLALVFFATPTFAQEAPGRLGLAAQLLGGLSDGAVVSYGAHGNGDVRQNGDVYEIRYEGEPEVTTTITIAEPEPCVFTKTEATPNEPTVTSRFDFNLARSVELLDSGALDDLNYVIVQFNGPAAVVQRAEDAGPLTGITPLASLVTSVPLDRLLAARDGILAVCPGVTEE